MKKKILTLFAVAASLLFATGAHAQKLGFNVGYASEYFPAFTVPEHNQVNNPHLTGGFLNVTYTFNFSQYLGVTVGVGGRYNMRQFDSRLLMLPASTKESQIVADVHGQEHQHREPLRAERRGALVRRPRGLQTPQSPSHRWHCFGGAPHPPDERLQHGHPQHRWPRRQTSDLLRHLPGPGLLPLISFYSQKR